MSNRAFDYPKWASILKEMYTPELIADILSLPHPGYKSQPSHCDCGALKTSNPNLHVSWCSTNDNP